MFDLDNTTFQPTAILERFTFNSTNDALYIANITNVSLVSAVVSPAVVPVPAAAWMMLTGVTLLAGLGRRKLFPSDDSEIGDGGI